MNKITKTKVESQPILLKKLSVLPKYIFTVKMSEIQYINNTKCIMGTIDNIKTPKSQKKEILLCMAVYYMVSLNKLQLTLTHILRDIITYNYIN